MWIGPAEKTEQKVERLEGALGTRCVFSWLKDGSVSQEEYEIGIGMFLIKRGEDQEIKKNLTQSSWNAEKAPNDERQNIACAVRREAQKKMEITDST